MNISFNSIGSEMLKYQQQLSSGYSINSAADNAAGLAILEKLSAQETGLAQGNENTADMQNLLKTAEGGLTGISDKLQRIRELALQASNGTLEQSDKAIIQEEINQLLQGIDESAKNTEFNNQKLLDGSFTGKHTASYADGSGKEISIAAMTAEALGLKDFNVTGAFNLEDIDNALSQVNTARSAIGAMTNAFDYTMNANSITQLNLAAAKSRMGDTDFAKATIEYNKNKVLQEYQVLAQKRDMENEKNKLTILK